MHPKLPCSLKPLYLTCMIMKTILLKQKFAVQFIYTLLDRKSVASFLEKECHLAQDSPDTQ